jgi:hypothetical protein
VTQGQTNNGHGTIFVGVIVLQQFPICPGSVRLGITANPTAPLHCGVLVEMLPGTAFAGDVGAAKGWCGLRYDGTPN